MKKLFKVCTLILSLLFVLSFFALAACGGGDTGGTGGTGGTGNNGGETPPPAHTHTFASTWSSDAENHWHAATCDHKTEKKDLAAHTFVGNTCSVCNYEKEVVKTAKCAHYCPICGKCIDLLYCEDDTEKCGGDHTKTFDFLAVESVFVPRTNESGEEEWPTICFDYNDDESLDKEYVGYLQSGVGKQLQFKIVANKACVVSLYVTCGGVYGDIFTSSMGVIINGDILERDVISPSQGKRKFETICLGCVELNEGENTIIIAVTGVNGGAGAKNMDKITFHTPDDVELSWTYTDNSDHLNNSEKAAGYVTPSARN